MHVSGSGGGTITIWPSGRQPCRAETPMLTGGCVFEDGGGGLTFQATPDPGSTFDGWPYPQCYLYPGGYCLTSGPQGPRCCSALYPPFRNPPQPPPVRLSPPPHRPSSHPPPPPPPPPP